MDASKLDEGVMSWPRMPDVAEAVIELRALAAEGRLAATYAAATREDRMRLHTAAVAVAAPVVFHRLTRVHEQRRGHWTCYTGMSGLAEACLDRFHDDLEAVVDDLLQHSVMPIHNLEGWITPRLVAVTVDAYRKRRGARGALQRPRLPAWLSRGLDNDKWLGELAIEILKWVGVPVTAGASLWPVDAWAERRGLVTGVWNSNGARIIEHEIEYVLGVMRTRPQWFEDHVNRPLGAKIAPLAAQRGASILDIPALALVEQHEVEDLRLTHLASIALSIIDADLAMGADVHAAVAKVIQGVFGALDLQTDLETIPGAGTDTGQRLAALASDPAELNRLVAVVLDILGRGGVDASR